MHCLGWFQVHVADGKNRALVGKKCQKTKYGFGSWPKYFFSLIQRERLHHGFCKESDCGQCPGHALRGCLCGACAQGVSARRGTAPVSAQSESKFGAYSALAVSGCAERWHQKACGTQACGMRLQQGVGFFDPAGSPASRPHSTTCVPEVNDSEVMCWRMPCVEHRMINAMSSSYNALRCFEFNLHSTMSLCKWTTCMMHIAF